MMHCRLPSGSRRAAALVLAAAMGSPAAAQDEFFGRFGDPDERQEQLEPPIPLPEGLRGTVRRRDDAVPLRRVDTIREVFQALEACWQVPVGRGYSGQEATVRLSFKRNGEVLGKPRIAYYRAGREENRREPFTRSVREAFERCTPLPFTEGLGRAVAGRIFAIRFVDTRSN